MRVTRRFLAGCCRPGSLAILALLCVAVSFGLMGPPASGEPQGPGRSERHITGEVVKLLDKEHLSNHALDDEISQRGIKMFLKSLDPMKLYFNQSDVDEFMKNKNNVDDMIKNRDVSLGYKIFDRFLKRVDERVALAGKLLDEKHDFTVDEEMVTDPDMTRYPRNEAEARDRWRKRIKYDLLVQKSDKKDDQEAIDKLRRRYNYYKKRMHQFDNDELLEMYLTSVTQAYDPHTTFMSKSTLANFRIALSLQLEGIGAALRSEDGQTIVTKIIPGGAADKHGKLKVEDRIVSVGQGKEGEVIDIVDMKLNDVVQKIRGKAGTIVRLGVMPADGNKISTLTIVRAKIELKDSEARAEVIEDGKKADGSPYRIGVIDLPSFYMDMKAARAGLRNYKSTTRDMRRLLDELKKQEVDAVVLDLRRNGGGSLTESINATGLFIDRGPVVQVKDQKGRVNVYDDLDRGTAWDGPLVIVTSKLSASASEILAGAIQDYGRGIIVGDYATHGKGTVQSLLDLGEQMFPIPDPPNLGALKITMQQFYRPKGESTQKRGVLADVVLPSLTTHMDVGEGDLDYAIDFDRVPTARIDAMDLVTGRTREQLRAQSAKRIEKSEKWAKLQKNIKRYKEQKARKSVSLNEEEFLARRAELDADKEEEKALDEDKKEKDDPVVKRDFYFNEVLAIAIDYVNALEKEKVAKSR